MQKRALFTLFLVVATELIGFGLIIPILPQIVVGLESSALKIGFLLGAYSLAQFFAAPILGSLSDRFGRKPVLMLSKLGTVIAYGIFAYSFSYAGILFARLLDGFTGGNISVARAYVADVTSEENRAKGMAVIGISFATGFLLGPALGGFLYSISDTHTLAALVAGGLSFVALLLTVFILEEPVKRQKRVVHSFSELISSLHQSPLRWAVGMVLVAQLVYMVLFSGFETTFSVFSFNAFSYSASQNSLLFLYLGGLAFLIQGGMMRYAFKNLRLGVVVGLIVAGIGFGLVGMSSASWLLGSLIVFSLGIAFINIHLPAYLSVLCGGNDSGKIMGIYESIGSLSRIIGPVLVYLMFFGELRLAYLIFGGVLLIFGVVFYFVRS